MTIYGIEGGIGAGKTLSLVTLGLIDLYDGKKLYSNILFKSLKKYDKNITYLDKDMLKDIFNKVKNKEIDMRNSTVLIQEAHNYMDSRNSGSTTNKLLSYWILQSRHTGEGSCDIIYDTQELTQVDIRLRRNTDFVIRPQIIEWEIIKKKRLPSKILLNVEGKVGHRIKRLKKICDVTESRNKYNTHELVDF